MPSNFRQADDPGRLAEDYGRLITLRALVEIVRIDLAGFDVKTFQVFQPGTQHPGRDPERTVERAENAIFGPQTEEIKPDRGDPSHRRHFIARKENGLGRR